MSQEQAESGPRLVQKTVMRCRDCSNNLIIEQERMTGVSPSGGKSSKMETRLVCPNCRKVYSSK